MIAIELKKGARLSRVTCRVSHTRTGINHIRRNRPFVITVRADKYRPFEDGIHEERRRGRREGRGEKEGLVDEH